MRCDFWRAGNKNTGRMTKRNMHELNKNVDNVITLNREPFVDCRMVIDAFFDVTNSKHPATILASLNRYWKNAFVLDRYKVVVRLVSPILDQNIIAGLGQQTRGV